jgi:hypothetical protein
MKDRTQPRDHNMVFEEECGREQTVHHEPACVGEAGEIGQYYGKDHPPL